MTHKTAGVQQGVTAASPCKWSQVMLSVTLYQRRYAARSVTCHCSVSRQTKHSALSEDPTSVFSFLKVYISCFLAGLYYMSYVCCTCTMCTYTMCMPDEFSWGTRHKDFLRDQLCSDEGVAPPSLAPNMDQKSWTCQGESQKRVMDKFCCLIISTLYLSCLCINILQDF